MPYFHATGLGDAAEAQRPVAMLDQQVECGAQDQFIAFLAARIAAVTRIELEIRDKMVGHALAPETC